MPLFGREIGARPAGAEPPHQPEPAQAPPAGGMFTAQLGAQPAAPSAPPAPAATAHQRCPLCGGALADQDGLWRCQGRCRASWADDGAGRLVDLASLPYGACSCCARRQPLTRSERGAACPASGTQYRLLPGGPRPIVEGAAPPSPAEALAAIDAALRANSARVAVHGLFDLEEPG